MRPDILIIIVKPLDRVLSEGGREDLLEILADQLSPRDLQTLMLEVYRLRAERESPARVMERYENDRFVRPSPVDPREFGRLLERAAEAAPGFEWVELSPVTPLGTCSALGTVSQNKILSTSRNTEVLSDATNVLALESASRRRRDRAGVVRLATLHRVIRTPKTDNPIYLPHFRLLGLTSAGRNVGGLEFEMAGLAEHIGVHLRLLAALSGTGLRVTLTAVDEAWRPALVELAEGVRAGFSEVVFEFDDERTTGRGYYIGAGFQVFAGELMLSDGGFTDWTQKLLYDRKERLLISGMGGERAIGLRA